MMSSSKEEAAQGAANPESSDRGARRVVAAICVVGALVTGVGMWVAVRTDRGTEARLLETQSLQAANVLAAAVSDIQQPLISALEVQASVLFERRRAVFLSRFARHVGPDRMFVSASLWIDDSATASRTEMVATLGSQPGIREDGRGPASIVQEATRSRTSVVRPVSAGAQSRIAYALADPSTGVVVYAERPLPADRLARVDPASGFQSLDYAIYLGPSTSTSSLLATDVEVDRLPLSGTTFCPNITGISRTCCAYC